MGFSIELADNKDASVIREVYDQAIQHANSVGMIDWPSPFPENTIKNFCILNELFVVRADDAEQGIVAAFRLTEEPNPRIWDDSIKALYIGKVAVGDQARGMNLFYGDVLPYVYKIATQSSIEEIRLDCLADNQRLRNFYTRHFEYMGDNKLMSQFGDELEVSKFSARINV